MQFRYYLFAFLGRPSEATSGFRSRSSRGCAGHHARFELKTRLKIIPKLNQMDRFLIKLERFSAWILLILVILYIISGYGVTKGIIDPVFSKYLHDKLLAIPFFIFFVLHVGIATKYALLRWRVFKSQKAGNVYIIIFGLVLLAIFLWFYFI